MKIKLKNPIELRKLLMKSGFSQVALAKKANTSPVYVSQILSGSKNPGPKIAKALADALGAEFDDIFFIETAC